MNKVQFFYNEDIIALERKINKWLAANKDINIVETNLTSIGKPSQRAGIVSTEKYVFYIRYEAIDSKLVAAKSEAEELLSAVTPLHTDIGKGLRKN